MVSFTSTESLRTAALDGALAFSAVLSDHRDLVTQSAQSGFQGLINSLDQAGAYQAALSALDEAIVSLDKAATEATKTPFKNGSTAFTQKVETTVESYLKNQADGLTTQVSNAISGANGAVNATQADTPERAAANAVKAAADKASQARTSLANGNVATARSQASAAVTDANNALTQAQSALNALKAQKDPAAPAARIAAAEQVVTAAQQTLAAAQAVKDLTNTPIADINSVSPTVYELSSDYSLSYYGDTGYCTLIGPDGKGVLIHPDGKVDSLDGSGKGWQFKNTSTFILPDDIKVTFTPNSSGMSVLAIRGDHMIEIEKLADGKTADATGPKRGGRQADAKQNDGYIFQIGSSADIWSLSGQRLGDLSGSREVVATVARQHEEKLDPTDVPIPETLKSYLEAQGISLSEIDQDNDGKLNEVELSALSNVLTGDVQSLQNTFETSLKANVSALEALLQLTILLDQIRRQADRKQAEKDAFNGEQRAEFLAIQRRLEAAREGLATVQGSSGTQPSPQTQPSPGAPVGLLPGAIDILQRIEQFFRSGQQPPASQSLTSTPPPVNPESMPGAGGQPSNIPGNAGPAPGVEQWASVDPFGQAMRRAGRLISGLSETINFLPPLEQPPTAPQQVPGSIPGLNLPITGLPLDLPPLPGQEGLPLPGEVAPQAPIASNLGELPGTPPQSIPPSGQPVGNSLPEGLQPAPQSPLTFSGGINPLQPAPLPSGPGFVQTPPLTVPNQGTVGQPGPATSSTPGSSLTPPLPGSGVLPFLPPELSGSPSGLPIGPQGQPVGFPPPTGTPVFASVPTPEPGAPLSPPVFSPGQTPPSGLTPPPQSQAPAPTFTFAATSQNQTSSPAAPAPASTESSNSDATIDPAQVLQQLRQFFSRLLDTHNDQLSRANLVFSQAQQTVQNFVKLVSEDDLLRDLVFGDDLSDAQQSEFAGKMTELRRRWGMDWGSSSDTSGGSATPGEEVQLVSRMVQSGMMI